MNRNVLIGLAALTVVLLASVFAWRTFFTGDGGGANERAGIVIVTDDMLAQLASSNDRSMTLEITRAAASRRANRPSDSVAAVASNAVSTSSDVPTPTPSEADRRADATLIRNLFADRLEAILSGLMTDSRRFSVADPTSLQPILRRMSAAEGGQPPSNQADTRDQTVVGRIQEGVTQAAANVGVQTRESLSATDPTQNADLASAARDLGVRYLLAVSLDEPRYTWTYNSERFRIEADPIYVYRLYELNDSGGRAVITGVARADTPVVVEVPWRLMVEEEGGAVAHLARAGQEVGLELQRMIARQVVAKVMDELYPATIARTNPVTMTRGTNDGIAVGDTVEIVYRDIDNAVQDGDVLIDVPETTVGLARVSAAQRNSATIIPAAGVALDPAKVRQYVVRVSTEGTATSGGASYAPSGGPGLGVNDIAARARAGEEDMISASVAVGQFRFQTDVSNLALREGVLESALAGRLARDQRINVLSRAGLDQLRQEQSMGSGGGRRSYLASGGTMARAGFLVLGDVTISTDRVAQRVSVAGAASRETSVQYYLTARSNLRIEALDSRLLNSFEISARTPIASAAAASSPEASRALSDAFAAAAAEQILPNLFPIEVVSLDGGIVLSRGSDVGLRVGDRVRMYRLGAPIIDRATNRQISAGARRQVGELTISDVQDTVSTASAVGAYTPQIGDVAERSGAAPAGTARARTTPQSSEVREADVPW